MDLDKIKKIRDMTGAGVNAIREALSNSNGDEEAALKYLRQKGEAKAEKRKEKDTENGTLGVYVHSNNKVVVVVEVNCETDFAAKSPDMQKLADDIALHIAATNPKYISSEDVSPDFLQTEKETFEKELEGKPEEVKQKILEGKMAKIMGEISLLDQTFFLDENKKVSDYISEMVSKIGEKVVVKSFYKMEVSQPTATAVKSN